MNWKMSKIFEILCNFYFIKSYVSHMAYLEGKKNSWKQTCFRKKPDKVFCQLNKEPIDKIILKKRIWRLLLTGGTGSIAILKKFFFRCILIPAKYFLSFQYNIWCKFYICLPNLLKNTVKLLYNEQHRDLGIVPVIERYPLDRSSSETGLF